MNPIIDPMFFYWLEMVGKVGTTAGFIGAAGWFLVTILAFAFSLAMAEGNNGNLSPESWQTVKKWAMTGYIITALCGVLWLVTPSQQTLIGMQVAKHVTVNNIQSAKEEVTEFIDYIMLKIEDQTKGDNRNEIQH